MVIAFRQVKPSDLQGSSHAHLLDPARLSKGSLEVDVSKSSKWGIEAMLDAFMLDQASVKKPTGSLGMFLCSYLNKAQDVLQKVLSCKEVFSEPTTGLAVHQRVTVAKT